MSWKKSFATSLYLLFLLGLIKSVTAIETEPLRLGATLVCCIGLLVADDMRRGRILAPPPAPAGKPLEED
ncbi:hypothetical protein LCGC14_1602100 [marine sediment metagenome]|uniref:Uncharacterized protein n=1 Tax=marine sediment metagenome TaxID=412755 RepID=A0A0F9IAW2_9ZZZZ